MVINSRLGTKRADAKFGIGGDHKKRRFYARQVVQDAFEYSDAVFRTFVGQSQQDYPFMGVAVFESKLSKIFVFGNEDPALAFGLGQYRGILRSRKIFTDPNDIVAALSKGFDRRSADVLVEEQFQWETRRAGRGKMASFSRTFSA